MEHALPFGKHRGQPPREVPSDYLSWLLGATKLSSGLRRAVTEELRSRGVAVPEGAPPAPPPPCGRCGPAGGVRYSWLQKRDGGRAIRRECRRCRGSLGFAPLVEPYTTLADQESREAPLLDALTHAEELGVRLVSDGSAAKIASEDWHRADDQLKTALRQCRHSLARMMGPTQGGAS